MSNEPSKILIAHGNTRKLRAVVDILREAGFDVIATPDGGDAFARFFEEEPGTVLCSAQLPGLSGVSFAAMVRSQAPATHVAILVDPDAPAELAEAPGVSTILEPFSLGSLHALFPALEGRTPSEVIDDQVPTTLGLFALAALKRFQRDNSLLAVVDDQGLHAIAGIAENEVLTSDARVVSEGEPGDGFYLVVEGQVKVTLAEKGNQEIARIGAGGFFGEMALLSSRPRSATIWTVGPTTLLFFPKEAFVPLLDRYPTMREVLSGVALKRTEENLWRSLFDDEDVQRSLGSLGAIDIPAPHEAPIAPAPSTVSDGGVSGEAAPGSVAMSGGAPQASSAGGGTWNPLPGPIEDALSSTTPPVVTRLSAQDIVDDGYDEPMAHVIRTTRRRSFLTGIAVGGVLGVFLTAFAVMNGVIRSPAPAASYVTEKHTAVSSPIGPIAPTVLPPVLLGPLKVESKVAAPAAP
ncbi:MAG: cyclic nucleotide-binding domain-containing protein, partial [Clostridia bacterium]|nr:cyclic nucleotide-binding domain-containing protein [Deltaproteobacteria bacterium]